MDVSERPAHQGPNFGDFEKKLHQDLYTEPTLEKKLTKINERIKALNEIDLSRPDSLKSQKASRLLSENFGVHGLTSKLQAGISSEEKKFLEKEVKEALKLLKFAKNELQVEKKKPGEGLVSTKRKRDDSEEDVISNKRQRLEPKTASTWDSFVSWDLVSRPTSSLFNFFSEITERRPVSEYDQLRELFPASMLSFGIDDEELCSAIRKQLSSLNDKDKTLLKEVLSAIPESDRKSTLLLLSHVLDDKSDGINESFLSSALESPELMDTINQGSSFFKETMSTEDKRGIVNKFLDIPKEKRAEAFEIAREFFACSSKTDQEVQEIIQTIKYALPIFTEGMHLYNKRSMVACIQKVPIEKREGVSQIVHSFFTENAIMVHQSIYHKDIFTAISEVPNIFEILRPDVLEIMKSLFPSQNSPELPATFLHTANVLINMDKTERSDIITLAQELFLPGDITTDNSKNIRVIFQLYQYSNESISDVKDLIKDALPFFTKEMNISDKSLILQIIRKTPPADREEVFRLAQELFLPGDITTDNIENIKVIFQLYQNSNKSISAVKDLIKDALPFFTEEMDIFDKSSLLQAAQQIPPAEREEVLRLTFSIFLDEEGLDWGDNESIVDKILKVSPADRIKNIGIIFELYQNSNKSISAVKDLIKDALPFFNEEMDIFDKFSLLQVAQKIPPAEREEVLRLAFSIFLNEEGLHWNYKELIVDKILKISPADREEVFHVLPFLSREFPPIAVLERVEKIPAGSREEVVRLAISLFNEKKDEKHNLSDILDGVTKVITDDAFKSLHKLFSDFGFIPVSPAQTIDLLVKQFDLSVCTVAIGEKRNKDAVFQLFCELTGKDERQVMQAMIHKYGTADIANNFSKISHLLSPHLLIDLTILLVNKEYGAVLQHLEDFPIHCLPAVALTSSSLLQEISRLQTDLPKLQIQNNDKIVFGDHSNISLDQLLTSFDGINFTNPDKAGYVSPSACSDDGLNKPPIYFKEGLKTLIYERIGKPEREHIGTPSNPNERAAWYARLEQILKEVVRLSAEKSSSEPALVSTEIVRLGAAGHHCGGRWLNDSIAAVNALSDRWEVNIENQGLLGIAGSWINNYKEGILENLTLEFGGKYEPHTFNRMAKCMIEYGIQPPNADLVDLNDSLMPNLTDSYRERIRSKFDEYFGAKNLSKFMMDKINEEIQLNRGPFIDIIVSTMRGIAESRIQDQLQVLDGSLAGEKRKYGEAKAKQMLEEEQIKLAIINDDKITLDALSKQNRMLILKLKSQFNSGLSNQVEERMEKEGLQQSDQPRVEEELRNNAKINAQQNIQKCIRLLSPDGDIEELKALGTERATSELRTKKDILCDEYLTGQNLLTYEKAEVYDNEMMTTVDFDRPRISFLGSLALLSSMGFFKSMAPASFEQQVALSLVPGIGRRSLEETVKQLNDEFVDGLYIRTFSDSEFEYQEVISQKIASEQDPSKSDSKYWSSASTVQAGLRSELWRGETGDRCGLVISSQAPLGGWNSRDMGTENVPATLANDDEIKDYFPNHFPPIDLSAVLNTINKADDAAWELVEKILDLPPGTASNNDFSRTEDFLLKRANPQHEEHGDLLLRLPDKYKSSFSLPEVRQRMREMAKERHTHEYNEAKIHYRPNDVLGVFVFNDPASLAKGAEFQKQLATSGIVVPLVTFEENKGVIRAYNQAREIPPHLP